MTEQIERKIVTDEDLRKLTNAFPDNLVKQRQGHGRGTTYDYITVRTVMNRLDEVVGPSNWQLKLEPIESGFQAWIGILCYGDEWIWKTDVSDETNIEGTKGGASGAIKRAAVHWGIARYLYGDGEASNQGQQQQSQKPMWSAAQKQFVIDNSPIGDDANASMWLKTTNYPPGSLQDSQIKTLLDAYFNKRSEMPQDMPAMVMKAAKESLGW